MLIQRGRGRDGLGGAIDAKGRARSRSRSRLSLAVGKAAKEVKERARSRSRGRYYTGSECVNRPEADRAPSLAELGLGDGTTYQPESIQPVVEDTINGDEHTLDMPIRLQVAAAPKEEPKQRSKYRRFLGWEDGCDDGWREGSNSKSGDLTVDASNKTKSKPKKLWKAMRGGWKKKDQAQGEVVPAADGGFPNTPGKQKPGRLTPPSPAGQVSIVSDITASCTQSTTTSSPPQLPSWCNSTEVGESLTREHSEGDNQEDDVPWAPTMDMLLKTGQLDWIDSDSDDVEDEDNEGSFGDIEEGSSLNGDSNDDMDGIKRSLLVTSYGDIVEEESNGDSNDDMDGIKRSLFVTSYGDIVEEESNGDSNDGLALSDFLAKGVDGDVNEDENGIMSSSEKLSQHLLKHAADNSTGDIPNDVSFSNDGSGTDRRLSLNQSSTEDMNISITKFFSEVSSNYLDNVPSLNICCDNIIDDETTLSKDTVNTMSTITSKSTGSGLKRRSLSLRSIGKSIVRRRGRSQIRRQNEQMLKRSDNDDIYDELQHDDIYDELQQYPCPSVEKGRQMASLVNKVSDLNEATPASQHSIPENSPPSRGRRSRSLLRLSLNRSSYKQGEKEEEVKPPKRSLSIDRAYAKWRDTNGATTKSSSSCLDDSLAQDSSFFEESELSMQLIALKSRFKTCLVCNRKIPTGEGIQHMGFVFCSSEGTCFQCGFCRRSLVGEENDRGIQIISNAQGSVLQCGKCAIAIMKMFPSMEESDEGPYQTSGSNSSNFAKSSCSNFAESSCLKQSIHFDSSCNLIANNAHRRRSSVESSGPSVNRRASLDSSISTPTMPSSSMVPRLSFARPSSSPVTSMEPGDCSQVEHAVKRLASKASVRLSLAASSGRKRENKQLSTLSFMQREDESNQINMAAESGAKVMYELDADAYGNPNHDGYQCSLIDVSQVGPPQMTSVALPELDIDEIDGTISQLLKVDFQWLDDDGCSVDSEDSRLVTPRSTGPAMMSIEAFQSTAVNKDTVRKVLCQTWACRENDIVFEFTFIVPFKKMYISWEIDEGDELDLTQCKLAAAIKYDQPLQEPEAPSQSPETSKLGSSNKLTSDVALANSSGNDVVNENGQEDSLYMMNGSMPNIIQITNTMSVASSSSNGAVGSTPAPTAFMKDTEGDEHDNFSELLSMATCTNATIALPSITYVKVEKNNLECEVGLSLIDRNGAAVVAEISQSGLFAHSHIKEGCEILAINGQCVRGPRSVMRMLKDITGDILIMLTDCPSPPGARFIVKKKPDTAEASILEGSDTDITRDIKFESTNGLVRVKDVAATGIFSETPINEGDICLSIDGVPLTSDIVAARALGRSQSIVAVLIFSLPTFWMRIVDFTVDEKYHRWWKKEMVCTLLHGSDDCAPITLNFDEKFGLCTADGNEDYEIDVRYINIILDRVMKLLVKSVNAYRMAPKERTRDSSRSLSVSPSGKMKNRSDVYRRALVKLDEMRENGKLSAAEYEAGKHALAQVAIQTGI